MCTVTLLLFIAYLVNVTIVVTRVVVTWCLSMTGQKYEFARKWKINIVSPRWIDDCVSSGYCLQEHLYAVDKPATKAGDLRSGLTSTPSGESLEGWIDVLFPGLFILYFCVDLADYLHSRSCCHFDNTSVSYHQAFGLVVEQVVDL